MKQSVVSSTAKSVCVSCTKLVWLGSQEAVYHIQKMSEGRIWRKILKLRKIRENWRRKWRKGKVNGNLYKAFEAALCNYSDVLEKKESER